MSLILLIRQEMDHLQRLARRPDRTMLMSPNARMIVMTFESEKFVVAMGNAIAVFRAAVVVARTSRVLRVGPPSAYPDKSELPTIAIEANNDPVPMRPRNASILVTTNTPDKRRTVHVDSRCTAGYSRIAMCEYQALTPKPAISGTSW